jgi:hypothetical protein
VAARAAANIDSRAGREVDDIASFERSNEAYSDERTAPMSKGMDKRKEDKKKPARSLQEKRAAKRAKREGGSGQPLPPK